MMKCLIYVGISLGILLVAAPAKAQQVKPYEAIYSGIPLFDDRGKPVSAHGANIVKDGDKYYLFGEAHTDTSNAFVGFNCYSSKDLCNWKFERIALPVQDSGRLGPNSVGERPKVMKCPKTGEYVMLMHTDDMAYKDQCTGYAVAKKITGPYVFKGPILFNGKPIRKWDMGAFQDTDGAGYLLIYGGLIYKLSDDYQSITEQVVDNKWRGNEAPAMFKKGGVYFWLNSDLTGWERNDNFYYTATSLKGPWTSRGNFAPKGTLTYNSQTTFVLPIVGKKDTTFMFMGDRWSFPRQLSAATYVWQPLLVSGTTMSINCIEAWQTYEALLDVPVRMTVQFPIYGQGVTNTSKAISYNGTWQNDTLTVKSAKQKGDSFSIKFSGTRVGMYGLGRPDGGYAGITLTNSRGKTVLSSVIDLYSKYPEKSLKFLSPNLPADDYTLKVTVMGENWYWVNKAGVRSGSAGVVVSFDGLVVRK